MSGAGHIYVDTPAGLAAALAQLRLARALAVDTEFLRVKTYYPIVGLVQVYDGRQVYLLDPLALPGLPGLAALLLDPGITKVLHACGEDLEVFQRFLGILPAPIFDTQIAAAVLGIGFSMGYQALVEQALGVTLAKGEARSDWLQRPLSQKQLEYASLDVIHLLALYERQKEALAASPKLGWVGAEAARLASDLPSTLPAEGIYRRFKGLGRLNGAQLSLLRSLGAWRENLARQQDRPARWLLDDKRLHLIAKALPESREALQQAGELTPKQQGKYGKRLLQLAAEARRLPPASWPPEASRRGLAITDERMQRLKRLVADKASRLEVAPELLASRRHLEALHRAFGSEGRLPAELRGWRQSVIGDDLLQALAETQ